MFMRSGYSAQTRNVSSACGLDARSTTQHHDGAADVLIGARDSARRLDPEAHDLRLPLELCAPKLCQNGLVALTHELDHPLLVDLSCAAGSVPRGQDAPLALDHALPVAHLHANWPAAVKQPADVGPVRCRTETPVTAVERLDRGEDRAREQAAAAQVRACAAQERRTFIAIAQQLDRVHWHHAQPELAPTQRERP